MQKIASLLEIPKFVTNVSKNGLDKALMAAF